jgi:hypothetical protein
LRIAFFTKSKARTRTTRFIADALTRAGHPVVTVRERKRRQFLGETLARASAVRTVRRFQPDLVLIHATDATVATCRTLAEEFRTVMFTPDCWESPLPEGPLALARQVERVLTVSKGQIPELLAAGVGKAGYLAEACDPSVHFPDPDPGPEWQADVAFIGQSVPKSDAYAPRRELIQRVHERFGLCVYGRGWEPLGMKPRRPEVYSADYRKAVGGAKIVLGRDWTTDSEWYFSNRTWFTLGCGGFLITNHFPGAHEIFENHEHLVWYESPEQCLELVEHYLARPEERARIARAGHAYALAHRTYDHFARDLVDIVEGVEPAFPPAVGSAREAGVSGT